MKVTNEKTILVIGGNGKTGSRVAKRLQEHHFPFRIASRSSAIRFDWQNVDTWKPALEGIGAVYITFQPDLSVKGAIEAITSLTQIAADAGVRKLVLLSGRGEPEAQACEQIVINSGLAWTIVRASWFNQNFSEGYLLEPILAGEVILPVGGVREPFVDADDIADVAFAALTDEKHNGQLYELTGPRLMSFKEVVEDISSALGRRIHYESITVAAYAEMLKLYGVPEAEISLISYLFTEVLDGRNESLTDGVQRALGRAPRDFKDYIKATIAAKTWA